MDIKILEEILEEINIINNKCNTEKKLKFRIDRLIHTESYKKYLDIIIDTLKEKPTEIKKVSDKEEEIIQEIIEQIKDTNKCPYKRDFLLGFERVIRNSRKKPMMIDNSTQTDNEIKEIKKIDKKIMVNKSTQTESEKMPSDSKFLKYYLNKKNKESNIKEKAIIIKREHNIICEI